MKAYSLAILSLATIIAGCSASSEEVDESQGAASARDKTSAEQLGTIKGWPEFASSGDSAYVTSQGSGIIQQFRLGQPARTIVQRKGEVPTNIGANSQGLFWRSTLVDDQGVSLGSALLSSDLDGKKAKLLGKDLNGAATGGPLGPLDAGPLSIRLPSNYVGDGAATYFATPCNGPDCLEIVRAASDGHFTRLARLPRAPGEGCSMGTLAGDADALYLIEPLCFGSNKGHLWRVEKKDGAVTELATLGVSSEGASFASKATSFLAVDPEEGGAVYISKLDDKDKPHVERLAKKRGAALVANPALDAFITSHDDIGTFAADAKSFYAFSENTLSIVEKKRGAVREVSFPKGFPKFAAVADGTIYWASLTSQDAEFKPIYTLLRTKL